MTQPPMVWELEAWSVPGLQLDLEYGKLQLEPEILNAGIAREVFLGLSGIPDAIDCEILQLDIESGSVTAENFSIFCESNGLVDSAENELSAFRFLENFYGRPLAWVHIPCNEHALNLAATINALLVKRGLVLREPLTNSAAFDSEGRALVSPTDPSQECGKTTGSNIPT